MKLNPVLTCAAVFAATVALAGVTAGAPSKQLSDKDQALYNTGKGVVSANHCDSCHGADLKGQKDVAPSLMPDGPMKNYNSTTFTTLMTTNVGYDGKKMSLPMAGKLAVDDIKALYVYLSNQ
ncbi:MAG: c-type cytochrome [Capsulimonadaceae bacterium]